MPKPILSNNSIANISTDTFYTFTSILPILFRFCCLHHTDYNHDNNNFSIEDNYVNRKIDLSTRPQSLCFVQSISHIMQIII